MMKSLELCIQACESLFFFLQIELSSSTTESFDEGRLSNRRSTFSDIREALPNRGLSISTQDLRLADEQENPTKPKRGRSFSLLSEASDVIKKKFSTYLPTNFTSATEVRAAELQKEDHLTSGKPNRKRSYSLSWEQGSRIDSMLSENTNTTVNDVVAFGTSLNLPSFTETNSSRGPWKRGNSVRQNSMPNLPTICITPARSYTDLSKLATECEEQNHIPNSLTNDDSFEINNKEAEKEKKVEKTEDEKHLKGANELQQEENNLSQQVDTCQEIQEQDKGRDGIFSDKADQQQEKSDEEEPSRQERNYDLSGQDERSVEDAQKKTLEDNVLADKEQQNSEFQTDGDIYYVIATYEASGVSEMTLNQGDQVSVEAKTASGWWMVRSDYQSGWAPSNFLVAAEVYEKESIHQSQQSEADQDQNGLLCHHDDDDEEKDDDVYDGHGDYDDDSDDDDDGNDGDYDDDDDGDYADDRDHDGDDDDDDDYGDGDYDDDDDERECPYYLLP